MFEVSRMMWAGLSNWFYLKTVENKFSYDPNNIVGLLDVQIRDYREKLKFLVKLQNAKHF
jgi:hypothetical protein